jgi:hypothetical protein
MIDIASIEIGVYTQRVNMHWQGIEFTKSFYTGLTSADAPELEFLKCTSSNIL